MAAAVVAPARAASPPPTPQVPAAPGASPPRKDRPRVPSASVRRAARPTSQEFLSDKATIALIRRTLCPQDLVERGRSTPTPIEDLLPPLTSRNDVDLQLYALISIIIRESVQNWYGKITPDETFVAEIVQIIAHCTRALEQRLRKVDLESLLLDEIPEVVDSHIRAYRASQNPPAQPPIEADSREIYHALCPLPALSPVPRPEDPGTVQDQTRSEATYRQLLVQGVLAVLLPTEDLENECLTALVGQIFSELIIGNLVANRLSEPWLLWEIFSMLAGLVHRKKMAGASTSGLAGSKSRHDSGAANITSRLMATRSSIGQLFWSLVQWVFLAGSSIRLLVSTITLSRSMPPRPVPFPSRKPEATSHIDGEKAHHPSGTYDAEPAAFRVAILDFSVWTCMGNLLEMDARMPWLIGLLSMMQWVATKGPGRLASRDGIIDRFFSHHIHTRLLDPALLPPLLRSIRAAIFPNNAPGAPGLVAPSSEEELLALRRKCAKALWALVPRSVGRLYFGASSNSSWRSDRSQRPRSGPLSSPSNNDPDEIGSNVSSDTRKPSDSGARSKLSSPTDVGSGRGSRPGLAAENEGASVDQQDGAKEGTLPSSIQNGVEPDAVDDRILSEIESGVLDVFSDAYCNKHLVYNILELILVRLVPELAEKGIVELWEERLS